MKRNSNYQDLIKVLAMIAMIVDHIGMYFYPEIKEVRIIGRYAMPIFTFFAGYNFGNRLNFRVLIAGCLLHAFSTILVFHNFMGMNILISIFLGQLYLYSFKSHFENLYQGYSHFVVMSCLWALTSELIDYGTLAIALVILGHMVKVGSLDVKLAGLAIASMSLLHDYINFGSYFNNANLIGCGVISLLIYFSLSYGRFEKNIPLNLKIISQHSLTFYCAQAIIIQSLWLALPRMINFS